MAIPRRFALIGHIHTPEDVRLEIAKGNVDGHAPINKFGHCDNLDAGVATDIWDGANTAQVAGTGTVIWVAPTQAQKFLINSSEGDDTAGGIGARTMQLWGLTDWDTAEITEVITMDGTDTVLTDNDYVIIHRKEIITFGASGPNIGEIKAVGQTDGVSTAFIHAGQGQTQMAIYGVPSNHTLFMDAPYFSILKGPGSSVLVNIDILCATDPKNQLGVFVNKHPEGATTTGSSSHDHPFTPPKVFPGPCIIKFQGNASAANTEIQAGFGGVLVRNDLLNQKTF